MAEETIVATGLENSQIKIFDYESKECLRTLKGHSHAVSSVLWEGRVLYSASHDLTIKVWKAQEEDVY